MNKGHLFILSGPSGVGKSTVAKELRRILPELKRIVTYTTRDPRPQEKNGIHYNFVTAQQFKNMIDEHAFLEWAVVHDKMYGTPKDSVKEHLDKGDHVLLIVDVQGGEQIKENAEDCHMIFLEPQSEEQLAKRLKKRKNIDEADFELRMMNAKKELAMRDFYDYRVINEEGDVKGTALKIADIVKEVIKENK